MKVNDNIEILYGDCLQLLKTIDTSNCILITDPPFNIGYKYNTYKDNMPVDEYHDMLIQIIRRFKYAVIIHYPEDLVALSIKLNKIPTKVISWVYNSYLPRQHRDIYFYNIKPNFNLVKQPFKNMRDKRIIEKLNRGVEGGRIYDWWEINTMKNISTEKTEHPCQMPVKVFENIIGIIEDKNLTIVDTFMGSGTSAIAAMNLDRKYIGIEIDKLYFEIAKSRAINTTPSLFHEALT